MSILKFPTLNSSEIAGLHLKFTLPLATGDVLTGHEAFDDVTEYTMEEMLAEMQPDTALLCLSLCAQNIAQAHPGVPVAAVLGSEAQKYVEHYGPVWLAYDRGDLQITDAQAREILATVPEDLEALGDLILAVAGSVSAKSPVSAKLCEMLGSNALMHSELAEEQLATLSGTPQPVQVETKASNVIQFPRHPVLKNAM